MFAQNLRLPYLNLPETARGIDARLPEQPAANRSCVAIRYNKYHCCATAVASAEQQQQRRQRREGRQQQWQSAAIGAAECQQHGRGAVAADQLQPAT